MAFVYIFTNRSNNALYIGSTNHIIRRGYEHREKLLPASHTAKYNEWKLVYYEVCDSILVAAAREKQLKMWHRAWKRRLITKFNPHWRDLYEEICSNPNISAR